MKELVENKHNVIPHFCNLDLNYWTFQYLIDYRFPKTKITL